eukprot:TRINITY_DN101001_c0_g1_i1.p1 TRINITY_DN101001_c0_g1~~TRINITY_DN101001_c0_g1_i1.p1  ORF type:complete len:270 (+),score=69.14 TRINITY_DN101001_c0_g1_i1:85-894(+)
MGNANAACAPDKETDTACQLVADEVETVDSVTALEDPNCKASLQPSFDDILKHPPQAEESSEEESEGGSEFSHGSQTAEIVRPVQRPITAAKKKLTKEEEVSLIPVAKMRIGSAALVGIPSAKGRLVKDDAAGFAPPPATSQGSAAEAMRVGSKGSQGAADSKEDQGMSLEGELRKRSKEARERRGSLTGGRRGSFAGSIGGDGRRLSLASEEDLDAFHKARDAFNKAAEAQKKSRVMAHPRARTRRSVSGTRTSSRSSVTARGPGGKS